MDPSALIFVALAVAWAVYLVPKALEHHDESLRNRTVSTFSHTMRVLARREPVSGRATRLVAGARGAASSVAPAAEGPEGPVAPAAFAAEERAQRAPNPRGASTRSAARRRRNVLTLLVLINVAVAALAADGRAGWTWMAVPLGLVVAWLVACRLMVRRERSSRRPARHPASGAPLASSAWNEETGEILAVAGEAAVVGGAVLDEAALEHGSADVPAGATGRWDPVDVPLPTYVSKPPAVRRTVRTIDLDSTGVWSSGRSESDSVLAREAEAARRDARQEQAQRRAAGS